MGFRGVEFGAESGGKLVVERVSLAVKFDA